MAIAYDSRLGAPPWMQGEGRRRTANRCGKAGERPLTLEAEANLRSLAQEAVSRLQRSFEIDAALKTASARRLIDEALASGPEQPLTRAKLDKRAAQEEPGFRPAPPRS